MNQRKFFYTESSIKNAFFWRFIMNFGAFLGLFLYSFLNISCSPLKEKTYQLEYFAMDSLLIVKFWQDSSYESRFLEEKIQTMLKDLETRLSLWSGPPKGGPDHSTDLQKINLAKAGSCLELNSDVLALLRLTKPFFELSKGSYDLGLGHLNLLWDFSKKALLQVQNPQEMQVLEPWIPSEKEKQRFLQTSSQRFLRIKEEGETQDKPCVFVENPGVLLDFGSVGKGYAVDKILELLKEEGIKRAFIDFGGNLYVLGSRPSSAQNSLSSKEALWRIGLQNPFLKQDPSVQSGQLVGVVALDEGSLATSGVYQRSFWVRDRLYHHILDARTGDPIENSLVGVSVMHPLSVCADLLSTFFFLLGPKKGVDFIESFFDKISDEQETTLCFENFTLPNFGVIWINKDRQITLTESLKDSFTLLDENFTISAL